MLQVSTNEVFAGAPGVFYHEYDPLSGGASTYARSKLAAERAVTQMLDRRYIVRIAWLFGPGGNNFPTKIAAAADRNGALRVVDDEGRVLGGIDFAGLARTVGGYFRKPEDATAAAS